MEIKIKDLVKVIPDLDPEASIFVAADEPIESILKNIEYQLSNTSDDEEDFLLRSLPSSISPKYDALVILLHANATITNHEKFGKDYNGLVIIDTLLATGNENRFIEAKIKNGTIIDEIDALKIIELDREDEIRIYSSDIFMQNRKYVLESGMLTDAQQKRLLQGHTI